MNAERQQWVLLVDDDRTLADGLAMGLERPGRTVVVCRDIESAEMALLRFPVSAVVSDVQFTSAFGFEGLHFVNRARGGKPHRTVLMTGEMSEALRNAAPAFGADAILEKPFSIDQLEKALEPPEDCDGVPSHTIWVPDLTELIEAGRLTSVFQPIVALAEDGARPFAYEALARVRQRWALGQTADLFEYASRRDMLAPLNRETMRTAVAEAWTLPGQPLLFLNVDPSALDARYVSALKAACRRFQLPMERVVVEVTERSSFPDPESAEGLLEELRDSGVRFALDDHGSAYSHLRMIRVIRPSFIKISASFGTAFEQDPYKTSIVKHTMSMAEEFGARAILEGIETAETAAMALQIGVPLAQGFFFGRPRAASQWSPTRTEATA